MSSMKRIHLHWTAGTHKANSVDLAAYHFVIEGDGTVIKGKFPVSANALGVPLVAGKYAAHTASANGGAIGVSLAAMHGATESPFNPGKYPITMAQVAAMTKLVADLCAQYNIPVTRSTVLTHAEVQGTLGIKQKNKWDIVWLPGYGKRSATEIGDIIRGMVNSYRAVKVVPQKALDLQGADDLLAEVEKPIKEARSFLKWLSSLFGGKK